MNKWMDKLMSTINEKTRTSSNIEFSFFKGSTNIFESKEDEIDPIKITQDEINKALNVSNLSFLLGSGCSSLKEEDGKEKGISTMGPMAKEFLAKCNQEEVTDDFISKDMQNKLLESLGIDINADKYSNNLERLLEVLYSAKNVFDNSSDAEFEDLKEAIIQSINKIKQFILIKCKKGSLFNDDDSVIQMYKEFYQKLIYRDKALRRPWVFTTNYDVFNERAMDQLRIPYFNGFGGAMERRFNPSGYRYSLAEQLDITNKKWSVVDNFIYLCKLHGSISWIKDGMSRDISIIKEEKPSENSDASSIMIYPTPLKQNASLGNPYSDLFREFHRNIVTDQSVLITIGYSFGDDHINNIIFQALTVPNFKLIAFISPNQDGIVNDLLKLDDPRIWIIGGGKIENDKVPHYFNTIVNKFMPDIPGNKVDTSIQNVFKKLINNEID